MFATPFYNKSLRTLIVAFGSIFSQIQVQKFDKDGSRLESVRVPISYAPKEKFVRELFESGSIDDTGAAIIYTTLPRIAFAMTSVSFDTSRKKNPLQVKRRSIDETDKENTYSFVEVPIDVSFEVSIYTRHHEDALQIVEQIIPFFTPNFNVSINFTDLHVSKDVAIWMGQPNFSEEYEGSMEANRRLITWSLPFTAKSFIFGPEKTSKIITEVITNIRDLTTFEGFN